MHKACFVFCFCFLLEVFFTLPSCQNNNQRTLALKLLLYKTTLDQIIIFRGFYLVGHSYHFGKGPDATFSCCAQRVLKATLSDIGYRMWPVPLAFSCSPASRPVWMTVVWSVEWTEPWRTAFHWSRFLQVYTDSATLGFMYFTQNSEFHSMLINLSKDDTQNTYFTF